MFQIFQYISYQFYQSTPKKITNLSAFLLLPHIYPLQIQRNHLSLQWTWPVISFCWLGNIWHQDCKNWLATFLRMTSEDQ